MVRAHSILLVPRHTCNEIPKAMSRISLLKFISALVCRSTPPSYPDAADADGWPCPESAHHHHGVFRISRRRKLSGRPFPRRAINPGLRRELLALQNFKYLTVSLPRQGG